MKRVPKEARAEDGTPICIFKHPIGDEDWFYTINPVGGYGLDEVLCCDTCIRKPENYVLRQRMIDAGATELEEK